MGLLIPFYIDPGFTPHKKTASDWEYLIYLKSLHADVPVIAIINPYNGPGEEIQESYTKGIKDLQAAGIQVVGYLPLGYFQSSMKIVERMYQHWNEWYPALDGMFCDEFPDSYDTKTERALTRLIPTAYEDKILIINPGVCMKVSSDVENMPFTIVVSWENRDYPAMVETVKQIDYCSKFSEHPDMGCLVLEQRLKDRYLKRCILPFYDWVFVTPYPVEANPWGKMDRRMVKRLFKLSDR